MNILLISNTYAPHVGGVARSVGAFRDAYIAAGHRVLVVAPEFPDKPQAETGVVRIPALQNFNASDFSVALPVPSGLHATVDAFSPDVIHSQHPFLLGMTAVRLARILGVPLVFTHHTLYEAYTHYVPGSAEALRGFVIELATCYANLADLVIAPSESIRETLLERGVHSPLTVVPTGVDLERFGGGDGAALRRALGLSRDDFVVGHMGRLAQEKNIAFLAESVAAFVAGGDRRYFLVVGDGDAEGDLEAAFASRGLSSRLLRTGTLEGRALVDALAAMDLFAFASHSETQGMVLTEAMAAGLPVLALDASGVREVVADGDNGRLLPADAAAPEFHAALEELAGLDANARQHLVAGALRTARGFSMPRCAQKALACYRELQRRSDARQKAGEARWHQLRARIGAEWDILRSINAAGGEAISRL